MESLKERYKAGNGPSSSHTMGPQRAAEQFKNKYPEAASFKAHLYGSLAATGEGHLTDYIIKKTLEPKHVEIIWREDIVKPYHPNGMMLEAIDAEGNVIGDWTIYSVGGGTIAEEGMRNAGGNDTYPHSTMEEIIAWCKENHKNFVDYVKTYDDEDIMDFLVTIKDAMKQSIIDGLNTTEVIPGKLNLERKAHYFYKQYLANKELNTLLYSYALAASEQNASGNVIVTAPTCGSAGVLPGSRRFTPVLVVIDQLSCFPEPFIRWIISVAFNPTWEMSRNWIGFVLTFNCSIRNWFTFLCIISLVEFAVYDCATTAVNFNRCDSLTVENPVHSFCNLRRYSNNFMVFKLPRE